MEKNIPFIFGRIASGNDFTDRENETSRLVAQFRNILNTIIISPRRWGKSSLVTKAGNIASEEDRNLRMCYLDLFNVRNEDDFYALLAQKVIASTSSMFDEALKNTKDFIRGIVPNIVLGDDLNEVKFKFSWNEAERNADDILDLAETIAAAKGIKIMICIDEFQNLAVFDDPIGFQKKLRAHWQTHQHVGYCLYGSKRHMMSAFFDRASKPFYKFGSIMFLDKIDRKFMVSFVMKRFRDTGKTIRQDAAEKIVTLADNHPYYIQQLAQISWFRTDMECSAEIVEEALDELIAQTDMMFRGLMESLSSQQICFMRAVMDGHRKMTYAVMREYGISSSTSAARSKKYLINEDILDDSSLTFLDPVFCWWLRRKYFTN